MTVKTERITILGTPNFKAFLNAEAKKEGVSISELVRNRCENKAKNDDEALLLELIKEVNTATKKAQKSLSHGIKDAESILAELKENK